MNKHDDDDDDDFDALTNSQQWVIKTHTLTPTSLFFTSYWNLETGNQDIVWYITGAHHTLSLAMFITTHARV